MPRIRSIFTAALLAAFLVSCGTTPVETSGQTLAVTTQQTTPTPQPTASPTPLPDGAIPESKPDDPALPTYELLWHDEFEGTQLDSTKWTYDLGYYTVEGDPNTWGWGNSELEHYTDSTENVFVEDGQVNIRLLHEPKIFPLTPDREALYSSGRIKTAGKFSFTYGRVDIRAKLPTGTGLWPALWMMPEDSTYGAWAASGEIDIMEAKGRLPKQVGAAVHYGGTWPDNKHTNRTYFFPDGQSIADYHVYTLIWEEDALRWYVDGEFYYESKADRWQTTGSVETGAPFDQPFYIILNLAAGGSYDGFLQPAADTIPASMQVDYVRVYK